MICDYLSITRWQTKACAEKISARRHAIATALKASLTLNHPADIINVVLQVLRQDNYELPSFREIARLVKHARELVNRNIFNSIARELSFVQKDQLEKLLLIRPGYQRTGYNALKQLPKNPSITHFRELLKHHDWLISLGEMKKLIKISLVSNCNSLLNKQNH